MKRTYAYFGIGVVMLMALAAFLMPKSVTAPDTVDEVTITSPQKTSMTLKLTSGAFTEGGSIPKNYTCDAQQISPPLAIAGAPAGTKSFVLIVEDPDVPKQLKPDGVFLHWTVFNISANAQVFPEGGLPLGAVEGANGSGKSGYVGPCPPKEYLPNEHRYIFTLYALDTMLALETGALKQDILNAIQGHILGQAELIGKYRRL